jgi:hypothetical protein
MNFAVTNPYSISVIQRCIYKQGYCKYESLTKFIIIYTVHFGLMKFVHDLEHNFCHPIWELPGEQTLNWNIFVFEGSFRRSLLQFLYIFENFFNGLTSKKKLSLESFFSI